MNNKLIYKNLLFIIWRSFIKSSVVRQLKLDKGVPLNIHDVQTSTVRPVSDNFEVISSRMVETFELKKSLNSLAVCKSSSLSGRILFSFPSKVLILENSCRLLSFEAMIDSE